MLSFKFETPVTLTFIALQIIEKKVMSHLVIKSVITSFSQIFLIR